MYKYRTPYFGSSAFRYFISISFWWRKYWPCSVDVPRIYPLALNLARLKVERTWPLHRTDPHRHSPVIAVLLLCFQYNHANRRSNPRLQIRPSPPSARLFYFCYFLPFLLDKYSGCTVQLSNLPYIRSLYKSVAWPSLPRHPSKGTFDDHCLHVSPL